MPFPPITHPVNIHAFSIVCEDAESGVNPLTIGDGDLTLSGPNGFQRTATLVSFETETFSAGNQVTATYEVLGPFTESINGLYTVLVVANQISDFDGNFIPGNTVVGTIDCRITSISARTLAIGNVALGISNATIAIAS